MNKILKRLFCFCIICVVLTAFGTEAKAQRDQTIGTAQVFHESNSANVRVVALDESHVFVMYKDGSVTSSSDLYGRVGQVDASNNTVTFGTAALIESESFTKPSVVAMSSTQVVVFYEADLTNDIGESRVLTLDLSTDAITNVGSAVQFSSGDVDAAGSHNMIPVVKLTSSTFALIYSDDESTDDGVLKIGTVSGTSISYGSEQKWSTGDVQHMSITALNSSKIAIAWEDDGTSNDPGKVIIGDVSGTNVSFGTEVTFHSASASATQYTAIAAISSDQFIVAYMDDADLDQGKARVGTVSGTSITISSSAYTFESTHDAKDITIDYLDGSEVVIGYNGSSGDNTRAYVAEATGTGASASIAFGNSPVILAGEGDDSWVAVLDADSFVMGYVDESDSNDHGEMIVSTVPSAAIPVGVSISSQTNVDCNGSSTGSLTATATPGTPNYTYTWSNGASSGGTSSLTDTNSGLAAGTYTVTVTDANGATATASSTLTQPTVLGVSISAQTNIACNGSTTGSATAAGSGGSGAYTYSWSDGQTTASASGLSAGTYTVSVTDANGCGPETTTVTVTEPTAIGVSISAQTNIACNGSDTGSATAAGSGGSGAYTYSWSDGQTTASASGLSAGTYTVSVTDANGCGPETTTVTVTEPTALGVSISAQTNIACNGSDTGSATAAGSGGSGAYTYSWSDGQTTASASGLSAGTYTVSVTDANGCGPETTTVTVTEPTALGVSISAQTNTDCNGSDTGSATAAGSGGTGAYTYSWSDGQTTASASGLSAGTYTVSVTDANGCGPETTTVTVTEPTALGVSISAQTNIACNGSDTGSATAAGSGGTGAYTYSWSDGQTTASASGLSAGTYTVSVTDANGCGPETTTVTVTEPTALGVSISAQTNTDCNGSDTGSATAAGSGGTGAYTYSWSDGQTTASASGLSAGTYTVSVTDANGCGPETTTVTVTEPTALGVSISAQTNTDCNGSDTGSATAAGSGGTGAYTYSWSDGQTTASASGLSAGTYTVSVTDANGCGPVTREVTLTEPTALVPGITVNNHITANGADDGQLTASTAGGTAPYTYLWSNGQTGGVNAGLAAGTYTVTVTDNNGCTSSLSESVLDNIAPMLASSTPSDDETNYGGTTVSLVFDESIVKGSGGIGIFDASDDSQLSAVGVSNPRVTVSGNTVTFDLINAIPLDKQVYLKVFEGAFQDVAGNDFSGISDKTTLNFGSATTPVLVSSNPMDEGTGFSGTTLTLNFDQNMFAGNGRISVFDASNDTEVTGAGVNSARVSFSGSTVTLDLGNTLAIDRQYYIGMPASALKGASDNFFPGILDKTTLNFESASSPVLSSSTPMDEGTDFTGTSLTLNFDRNMVAGIGRISVMDASDDTEVTGAGVGSARVNFNNSVVTVNLINPLPLEKQYYVIIPASAIKDTNGVFYPGILDKTTLNFGTPTIPALVSTSPVDGTTEYSGTSISFTFDRNMFAGAGRVSVYDATDDTEITGAGVNSGRITIVNNVVTLDLINPLRQDKEVYVNIPASAFKDVNDNFFPGIHDKTTLSLTSVTTPHLVGSSPSDNAVDFTGTTITLTFDRNVQADRGRIRVLNAADDSEITGTGVSGPRVAIADNVVTIDLVNQLPLSVNAYVNIPSSALKDANNVHFSGILDKTTFNFSTATGPSAANESSLEPAKTKGSPITHLMGVYPNPGAREITIDLSGMESVANLQIVSLDGVQKLRKIQVAETELKVDVSRYTEGIYLIVAQMAGGSVVYEKFMIKR